MYMPQLATALLWRRDGKDVRGVSTLRLGNEKTAHGAQVYDRGTSRRAQKEVRAEPQKARTETQDQALVFVGVGASVAGQFLIRQPLTDDAVARQREAVP